MWHHQPRLLLLLPPPFESKSGLTFRASNSSRCGGCSPCSRQQRSRQSRCRYAVRHTFVPSTCRQLPQLACLLFGKCQLRSGHAILMHFISSTSVGLASGLF